MNDQIFIDEDGFSIYGESNLREILDIARESLTERDQARLVQALTPSPTFGEITPCAWMLNTYLIISQAARIMNRDQLREWAGWEAAIKEMPLKEAQRLENLGRLVEGSSIEQ